MQLQKRLLIAAGLVILAMVPGISGAQFSGQSPADNFHDKSILKPPAGSKVAIIVFEDLGCPACAKAHPFEQAIQKSTGAALVRRDFPIAGHVWTFDGAVCARYIEDRISPVLADQFRSDVFASQMQIASREEIHQFLDKWLKSHGQNPPFLLDPGGKLASEVRADYDLGLKLNVEYTPTIVVATRDRYQVVCGTATTNFDPTQLERVTKGAIAQVAAATPHPAPGRKIAH